MTKQFHILKTRLVKTAALLSVLILLGFLPGCNKQNNAEGSLELIKAKKLIAEGNYTEAFMQLNQALAEAPRDPQVHLNLGWLYLYSGDNRHAAQELRKLEELGPDLAETDHLRGAFFSVQAQQRKNPEEASHDQEKAVSSFRQSLQKDAKNNQTYFDLASSLVALDRQEEALDVLDKGFDYIPAHELETQVNFEIASCAAHAKLQLFEEAIADCEQAYKFTENPASRERIEEMIQNMKLMNPAVEKILTPDGIPKPTNHHALNKVEENAMVDDSASD